MRLTPLFTHWAPRKKNKIKKGTIFSDTVYFKELIFNTLLFADDQLIIADTEGNLQRAVYLLYNISKEYNLEIATSKTKVFGFVGTDHLRAKIIINDETLRRSS